jgi:hypothetical protein
MGGAAGRDVFGDPLPQITLDGIRRTRLGLKGPLTTPVGGGYRSSNVRLREEFHLYANVRLARTLIPGGRYEAIDGVNSTVQTEQRFTRSNKIADSRQLFGPGEGLTGILMCGLSTAFLFAILSGMYAGRTKPSQNSSMKPRPGRTPLLQKTQLPQLAFGR